jgi:hypothetical protein
MEKPYLEKIVKCKCNITKPQLVTTTMKCKHDHNQIIEIPTIARQKLVNANIMELVMTNMITRCQFNMYNELQSERVVAKHKHKKVASKHECKSLKVKGLL